MRQLLRRNRFLISFALLSSFTGSSVGLAKIVTSLYAVQLGAHEGLLGLIASSQSIGVLIMSMPLGLLVERHGPEPLFVLGTLIAGVLYLLIPLVPTPAFLLGCSTTIGFFMPFRFVALNTVFLRQLLTLGHAKAGWYRGTHMAGMFLVGPLVATAVIERFLFAGAFLAVAAGFALTALMSPIVFAHAGSRDHARRRLRWSDLGSQLATLLRDRTLRRLCAVESCGQGIHAFYSFFIVVIAVKALGFSNGQAAGLVAAQGGSYVLSLIALGGLATRYGPARVQRASCLLLGLALLTLGLATCLPLLWFGALLLGLSLGLTQIIILAQFAQIGARYGHGQMAGLHALVGPAGAFVGSLAGGALGRGVGLQSVFLVLVPLVALLSFVRFDRHAFGPSIESESCSSPVSPASRS